MSYIEDLPEVCPPQDATTEARGYVWRLANGGNVSLEQFLSHGALGKPVPPKVDLCEWHSCSVLESKSEALKKLPNIKRKCTHLIRLYFPQNAGYSKKKGAHIDLWMFNTFNPVANSTSYPIQGIQ